MTDGDVMNMVAWDEEFISNDSSSIKHTYRKCLGDGRILTVTAEWMMTDRRRQYRIEVSEGLGYMVTKDEEEALRTVQETISEHMRPRREEGFWKHE